VFLIGIVMKTLDCEEGIILYVGKMRYVIPQTDGVFILTQKERVPTQWYLLV